MVDLCFSQALNKHNAYSSEGSRQPYTLFQIISVLSFLGQITGQLTIGYAENLLISGSLFKTSFYAYSMPIIDSSNILKLLNNLNGTIVICAKCDNISPRDENISDFSFLPRGIPSNSCKKAVL